MTAIPNRAPIDYVDLRRPYNDVRAASGLAFITAMAFWGILESEPLALLVAAPAIAVVVDAVYRRTNPRATPLPGILIDATVLGIALAFHGPDPGLNGLAVMTILVSASLLLPLVQVLGAIGYLALLSAGMLLLEWAGAPLIGVLGLEGEHIALDALIVGVFIIAVGALLFLAVRVILTAQDRQADALAQERRAVQLKNEFVSMVSHELRTPLTGIAGFTDTLSERWTKLPKQEVDEFLDIMGHETDHLTNLVEDILVIPRLEAGQLRLDIEEFGLAVEAHSIADILLDSAEYSISIPAGVVVAADRTRLRQILRNLVENAKKYGGDQILIDGELSAPGLYTVSVSDNGPGVDVDDQERIFGHFEQLSTGDARIQQGVGLGLPIARKLASAMGGDLWYEDRFPVGAKFCFSVQLADGDRPTEETIPHAHAR